MSNRNQTQNPDIRFAEHIKINTANIYALP